MTQAAESQLRVLSFPLTNRQCTIAAVCHLVILLPVWGLLGAFWIWHTRRDEHPELRFQAAQAIYFQALWLLITTLAALSQLFFRLLGVLNASLSDKLETYNLYFLLGVSGLMALLAVIGAVKVRVTGTWEYPVLGPTLRREMHRAETEEQREAE